MGDRWRPLGTKVGYSIAFSAGEASGDLSGAYLASALRDLCPDLVMWGAGGTKMAEAGVDVVVSTTNGGTIGITETLKALPGFAAKYLQMRRLLLERRPDVFVPIDFGAFNMRLAQIAHKNGIRVVYYFPPGSWRKNPKNGELMRACGGRVITPFPWSADRLQAAGVDARFVGHPLVDVVKPTKSREQFFEDLELSDSALTVGLLPGSRSHEIREHLGPMIGMAVNVKRELGDVQFVVGAAKGRGETIKARVRSWLAGVENPPVIKTVEAETYNCMAHSDFLVATSGTATLEAAILGTPMVIIYQGSPIMRLEYHLRKSVLEDYIGLPNIVAGREVCPEMVNNVTIKSLTSIVLELLTDKARLKDMREQFVEIKKQLGNAGAVQLAALMVLDMGGVKSTS